MSRSDQQKYDYMDQVYDVVRLVPSGRVTTYGRIADYLGLGSARMVGWALNRCHGSEPPVPAHRVVNRLGELSGRMMFDHPEKMASLLREEGVDVEQGSVVAFERVVWHPEEIELT